MDLNPHEIFSTIPDEIDRVWVDNAGIQEDKAEQEYTEQIVKLQREIGWKGLYFGVVASKYQKPVKNLEHTARIAANCMDMVATSGPGIG